MSAEGLGLLLGLILTILNIFQAVVNITKKISKRAKIIFSLILISTLVLFGVFIYAEYVGFPVAVEITYPEENQIVTNFEVVRGTSANIPRGNVITVVVYIPELGRYYPMLYPAIMQKTGEWLSGTSLGGPDDSGKSFTIMAILSDPSAQEAFNEYNRNSLDKDEFAGIMVLPSGAEIIDLVTVIRK